jgi:hypothetical protein
VYVIPSHGFDHRSHSLDQAGQERGAARQLRDQYVLVRGVRSVAYGAEAV